MDVDDSFMRRALERALAPEIVSPNPRVGAVVVADGRVVAEGHHDGPGTDHAERVALARADASALLGATLYVNLEPCIHEGRTPPCVPALVAAGLARVVVAIEDPDPRVHGGGIAALRSAGIDVTVGVMADEATRVNASYLHHRTTGRPLVTLKLALSVDGRLGAPDGGSRWISSQDARAEVHRRRRRVDAVLVGSGTVVADDPSLTARDAPGVRQPDVVVVDSSGRVPAAAKLFAADRSVLIATGPECSHETQTAWKEAGAEVIVLTRDGRGIDLGSLLAHLGNRGALEIYCEGGASLATSLLALDLVDRLEVFWGPLVLGAGGPDIGSLATVGIDDARRWELVSVRRSGPDVAAVYDRRG